jgi:phage baseplate assembly protein gpV
MALSFTDIQNQNELNTSRASTTVKTHGATATYTDNTGSATTDYAYHGGASQSYTMMETKAFNPNNMSALTQNDKFETVGHDSYSQVRGMKETRVFGDFNIITGSPNFFTDGLASSYIQKRNEIPAGPETADEAVGTISGAKYTSKSTPDPKSGSTVGKTGATGTKGGSATTPPEPAIQNRGQVLPLIQKDLTKIEQNMGVGGNVKIMSCRHLYLQCGAAASTMDPAIIKKKGRQYSGPFTTKKKEEGSPDVKSGKGKPSTNIVEPAPLVSGPQVETVETTANMPFGNIYLKPSNQLQVDAGTGGISMISGGTNTISGMGNTNIMSPAVLIQGSQSVDVKGVSNVTLEGAQATVKSPITVIEGNVHIKGTTIIKGDLHVEGKLTVGGVTELNQSLAVAGAINGFAVATIKGNIRSTGGDVYSNKYTLNTHWHQEQGDGKPTSAPKG